MPLLDIHKYSKKQDIEIAKKSKSSTKKVTATHRVASNLYGRIAEITEAVNKNLGQFKSIYKYIIDEDELVDYLSECRGNGYISIDTETDGLDPLRNILAGVCIYTHGQQGAYVPLNHINYITGERAEGQLPVSRVIAHLTETLKCKPVIDMFNAKFDMRFLRANGLHNIYCTWDGYLAGRLLNENETQKGLKYLHNKYCLGGKGDAFSFDDLFKNVPFTMIPYTTGYLYAAHDPHITTELCDYQRQWLRADSDREDMRNLYKVFTEIEMPCVPVMCDMEDNGILFDGEYAQNLSVKYHQLEDESLSKFHSILSQYSDAIDSFKESHPAVKLDDPINISSPKQLAVLFYDILKIDPVDSKSPRGTGVHILSQIDNPIAKAILEYRGIEKLISTYIDKLPTCVNPNDGRIHCNFNQYGADTGRMSSSDPNLQNIPSHNKDIRKMFIASPGCVLMSSDFSQQEPKCLAALCRKQGDSQMYDTFMEGKDLYSEIASKAFGVPYDDCREFRADGTTNKAGKERRTQAKSILLGVLYGRGEASIGEQLGCSTQEAKDIKDSVFRGFPAIKQFEQDSLQMAYEVGYVTTVCGRKRRLPDLQLDEYEFKWVGENPYDDLLDFDSDSDFVPDSLKNKYLYKLNRAWGKEKRKIFEEANKEGLWIVDNSVKIADATRQCVNSRIQGSAADLTKLAMIELSRNDELKQLGFKLLIPVHDEIIAECPEENMKECSKLLAETMSKAAEKILEMPIKCDVEITRAWYGETVSGEEVGEKETTTSHGVDVEKLRR